MSEVNVSLSEQIQIKRELDFYNKKPILYKCFNFILRKIVIMFIL